jgi:hypothetical protein
MSPQQRVNWGLIVTVLLALMGWAVAGLRSYADDTAALKERIAIVETKADETKQWRERMEAKVDRILLELAQAR